MGLADIKTGSPVDIGPPTAEALNQLETEILRSLPVLESGLFTLLRRYTHLKTDDGMYLTPETAIEIGDPDNPTRQTVFAGYHEKTYDTKVIFLKDPATNQTAEWIVINRYAEDPITDGVGHSLMSDEGRSSVREVLDAMKKSYDHDVTAMADGFDVQALAAERWESTSPAPNPNNFKVVITSGWEREGEKSMDEIISATRLSEALKLATEKFKKINGRSDVQATSFSVSVPMPEGNFLTIPREVVAPLFRALSGWDQEAYQVERAKADLKKLKT